MEKYLQPVAYRWGRAGVSVSPVFTWTTSWSPGGSFTPPPLQPGLQEDEGGGQNPGAAGRSLQVRGAPGKQTSTEAHLEDVTLMLKS